jgi:hypothetical protein
MPRLDLHFLIAATLSLLLGVVLGIWMGVVHEIEFASVHVHIALTGWASLGLFGLTYRSYPEMAQSRIAIVHFLTASSSAVLFPLGISLSILGITQGVALFCAFIWLVSVVLFLANLARTAFAGPATPLHRPGSSLGSSSSAPGAGRGFGQWRESL